MTIRAIQDNFSGDGTKLLTIGKEYEVLHYEKGRMPFWDTYTVVCDQGYLYPFLASNFKRHGLW